jgi:hypothetical protein
MDGYKVNYQSQCVPDTNLERAISSCERAEKPNHLVGSRPAIVEGCELAAEPIDFESLSESEDVDEFAATLRCLADGDAVASSLWLDSESSSEGLTSFKTTAL